MCKQIPNDPLVCKKSERRLFSLQRDSLTDQGMLKKSVGNFETPWYHKKKLKVPFQVSTGQFNAPWHRKKIERYFLKFPVPPSKCRLHVPKLRPARKVGPFLLHARPRVTACYSEHILQHKRVYVVLGFVLAWSRCWGYWDDPRKYLAALGAEDCGMGSPA